MNAALKQKELGLFATALNNSDLVTLARDVAKLISAERGSCTIDDVRSHDSLKNWKPSSPNFWGSVFHEKGWRFIEYVPSTKTSNHSRRIVRWTWQP